MKKPTPQKPAALNMEKQYRRELRSTDSSLRKIATAWKRQRNAAERAKARAKRDAERSCSAIDRQAAAIQRGLDRKAEALVRRKSILIGRLS
jgi:cysteinyl-tRNA synthetase